MLKKINQFSDDDDDDRSKSFGQRNRGGYDSPLASYRSDAGKPPSGRLPNISSRDSHRTDNKKPQAITYPSSGNNKNFNDSDDSYTDNRFSKKAQSSYDKGFESKYDK